MVGVAVKFTVVPAQTVAKSAARETLTGKIGFTVKVTVPDAAGLPLLQVSFEVRIT